MSRKRPISLNSTISSNLLLISARRHAQDGAVQLDVLAAGELGVEAGAHLEQARHPPSDLDPALGRLGDVREHLQQRALAGAVAADDAQRLAVLDLEI